MIKIADEDFNKDMDSYIQKKRKGITNFSRPKSKVFTDEKTEHSEKSHGLFNVFRRRIPSDEEFKQRIKKMKHNQKLEAMEDDIKDIQEEEDEMEEKREGIVKRFLKLLRKPVKDNYSDEEEIVHAAEMNKAEKDIEQLKNVIKITHKWLERLPPEQLNEFKRSEDFQRYKDALKQLKLIK